MKKIFPLFFLISAIFLFPSPALAVCPVCTVAVGAGLGLSRFLGFDDTVSGIWIGGFLLSSSLWLANWLETRKYLGHIKKKLKTGAVILLTYLLVLVPLLKAEFIGHPLNKIWGVDKLALGIILGSLAFWGSQVLDKKVREIRGKRLFDYQKIVFSLICLIIASVILWIITRN